MSDGSEEEEAMLTLVRALSARENLWEAITAVLPIVVQMDDQVDVDAIRDSYAGVFESMGLSGESDRDMALLAGAVEAAQWVVLASEMAGVNPYQFWEAYLARKVRTE